MNTPAGGNWEKTEKVQLFKAATIELFQSHEQKGEVSSSTWGGEPVVWSGAEKGIVRRPEKVGGLTQSWFEGVVRAGFMQVSARGGSIQGTRTPSLKIKGALRAAQGGGIFFGGSGQCSREVGHKGVEEGLTEKPEYNQGPGAIQGSQNRQESTAW